MTEALNLPIRLSDTAPACDRPNILYVTHRVPYPPDKGDRIRNHHLLRFLAPRANVYLACLADEVPGDDAIGALRRLTARLGIVSVGSWAQQLRMLGSVFCGRSASEGAFASSELRTLLASWAQSIRFDVVMTSASSLAPYLRLPALRDVPAVVDLMDVDSQKWFDYAAAGGPRSWLYQLEGRRVRHLEQALPFWTRGVTLVSKAEAAIYRRSCPGGRVVVATNGVDLEYYRPIEAGTQPACVFVGALDYRPNIEGVCWFCREVWPRVRRRQPQAELWLVGRRPASAVRRLAQMPGVQMVGQVPDVRPYLARAALAVVPLNLARGVQNKVLEALAMAKAVVASPPALAALETQPGAQLLAASTPGQWEEAVVSLLGDEERCRQLGAAGRAFVETHHHWDRCLEPFAELLGLPEVAVLPSDSSLIAAESAAA